MYSGLGGQFDYIRGVQRSRGGKSIIALQSTAKGGELSRIVPTLGQHNVVTSSRNDVDYIVTEFGVAALSGKTELQRAEALVRIAHPKFRDELERVIQQQFHSKTIF